MPYARFVRLLMTSLVLSLSLAAGSSSAWEFSMEGEFVWKGRFVGQLGSRGFFGKYDLDGSSTGGDYASANGWAGGKLNDLTSSSSAEDQVMETNVLPELRINQAIRLRGEYRIGGFNDPIASSYTNSVSPGVQVAISEGQWTMWWVTCQTPWGVLVYGKRPLKFGCGLQYNGAEDLTSESLLLVAPGGPFRIGLGFYPWRQQPDNPFRQNQPNNSFAQSSDNPYFNPADTNAILRVSPVAFLTYDAGSLSLGIMSEYFTYHRGPESQRFQSARAAFPASDIISCDGAIFGKYNNGRFFFNAELDWMNRISKFQTSQDGLAPAGSHYIEAWRWMAEAGFIAGPLKASFIYAWLPGPDRRHGALIHRQPYFYGFGNHGLFIPYSLVQTSIMEQAWSYST